MVDPVDPLLFVYGTLRPGFDGPMAQWLWGAARHLGPATAAGALYRIADYPGFVPGGKGVVTGDLFALPDAEADAVLHMLDNYEECSPDFLPPHEYRRERLTVHMAGRAVEAWVYVYARPVDGLERIEGGNMPG